MTLQRMRFDETLRYRSWAIVRYSDTIRFGRFAQPGKVRNFRLDNKTLRFDISRYYQHLTGYDHSIELYANLQKKADSE